MQIILNEPTTNDSFATLITSGRKIHTSIAGPMEVKKTKFEQPHKPFFDISILPSSNRSSTVESALASQVVAVLEEVVDLKVYARKQITITVQIVDQVKDSWQVQLVDIANSVFLACVTAGIKLNSSFWGTVVYLGHKGEVLHFDSKTSDESIQSVHRVIYGIKNSSLDQLILLDSNGEFVKEDVWTVLKESGKIVEEEMLSVRDAVGSDIGSRFMFK